MTYKGLVSVVIPIYNAEKYLEDALTSIQVQTYSNLEILCVDDCSTDGSYSILDRLEKNDNRIKIFKNDSNQGIVYSLNKAISHACGEIIVRMDADDISLHNRIQCQVDFLNNNNVDFVGTTVKYITEGGVDIGQSSFYSKIQIKKYLSYKSTLGHPTWALYKKIYDDLGGYRNLAPAEDYDFLLRAVKSGVEVEMMGEPLLKFRTQSKEGGTALANGLVQRRMFNYVRDLNEGSLNYSIQEIERVKSVHGIHKMLFYYSQVLYYKATSNKHRKNYIVFILYLIPAIIMSPYQAQFVYRSFVLKLLSALGK